MSIFQVIAVIFAAFMLYVVRVKSKKYHFSGIETAGWYGVWGGFIILALFPQILLGVVGLLKFSRVFDLLVVISFMILSGILFSVYFSLKDVQHKIEFIIRREAIDALRKRTKINQELL